MQGGPTGSVTARIVRPAGATVTLPVVICLHGAGRLFGTAASSPRPLRKADGVEAIRLHHDVGEEARAPVDTWTAMVTPQGLAVARLVRIALRFRAADGLGER